MVNARQVLGRLGFGRTPRRYGTEVVTFDLPRDGRVSYARWLHPRERPKSIDQAVVDHLRKFVAPGDVAIDIGAHTGDTALPLALAVGPTGLVLALEPNPYVFPCLVENAALNGGRAPIEPLPFAATREDGPVEFHYSDAGFCNGGRHEASAWWRHGHTFALTIEGRNLEQYLRESCPDLRPRVRFLKVDTEGNDLSVLETLTGLLADARPYVRTEVFKHSSADARRALLGFLRQHGYRVFRVEHEASLRGPEVNADAVMDYAHYDIFCEPASCRLPD